MPEVEIKKDEIQTPPIEKKEDKPNIKNEVVNKSDVASELGLVVPRNMNDYITNTMNDYVSRGLVLPKDYNVENAVLSSYMIIKQDDKLMSCSKESIQNALIDMTTMGLNASKKQCYFIPYSGKLQLSPSYFGKITAIKRIKGVVDVASDVIYKSTEYELVNDEYGNDEIKITKPCPLEERKLDNIIGAWCKIILNKEVWGRELYTCIMTMEQIEKSWNQGSMKGQSPAHKNFRDEMAKKSVINRTCKMFVNSAKDNDILIETINKTIENDYTDYEDNSKEIKEHKVIDL